MKRKLIYSLTILLGLWSLQSCDESRLDLFPFNSIELSQSFKTIKDAKAWDNGMYSFLRARTDGIFTFITDVQADQLNATLDYGNRNGSPHRWDDTFLNTDNSLTTFWQGYYSALNNVNIAIANYDNITLKDGEAAELNRYKGNAHFLRAYYYHRLMLRFAKPFNTASATTDLGVPLVLVPDITAQPARATTKAVYDQIMSDLTTAKGLLSGIAGTPGSIRITSDAVTALEARVKLHMRDWAGAKASADALISGGKYPLIKDLATFKKMWGEDFGQEDIFQIAKSQPNELGPAVGIYFQIIPATGRFSADFVPSQWVVDSYDATDIRKETYFQNRNITIQGFTFNNISLVNKFPGNPALFTAANTNNQHKTKIFRIAEMYLISAEAAAELGSNSAAITTINLLKTARGVAPITATSTNLLSEIRTERTKELAFEGFRLDDLNRWNQGFQRRNPQSLEFIQTGPRFNTLTIAADNDKFVWGIPANDITVNPNLAGQQNPGW